ncbi:unnamed protein product [Symbiodinium sp. CCMP2592]|nr:unnamed protein product [Symbiodinium sp. CCMP2592]
MEGSEKAGDWLWEAPLATSPQLSHQGLSALGQSEQLPVFRLCLLMRGAPPPKPGEEAPQEQHRAFVNAPFQHLGSGRASAVRLKVETYEDFAKLLPSLGREASSRASVEEELRKLNIDPKIFYSRQPLKVSQYTPEDMKLTCWPFAADFGFEPEAQDLPPLPAGFHPPARHAEAEMSRFQNLLFFVLF